MRLVHRSLAAGVAAIAFGAATAASASAATIQVFPGGSIQDAVTDAHAGDTIVVHPGVYRESVQIKKNNLTLRGAGSGKQGTVIKHRASSKRCGGGGAGICIIHHKSGKRRALTAGTQISGFRIKGFHDAGGLAQGAKNTVFRDNAFVHNAEYGAAAFSSRGTKFLHNVSTGSEVSGFYIGDSPHANAVLRDNLARRNGEFAFFLRDSSHAVAVHNRAVGNCLGMALVNTGSPGGVHDWSIRHNRVLRNNRSCPGGGGPPISGSGIVLLGATHNAIRNNLAKGNRAAGAAVAPGGIVVASSVAFGGSNSAHNVIAHNRAIKNKPADIVWDGKGKGNRFDHNRCHLSQPGGLCQ